MNISKSVSKAPLWTIGVVCAGFVGMSYAADSGATSVSQLRAPDKVLAPNNSIQAAFPELQEQVSRAIETVAEDPLPTGFPTGVPEQGPALP